VPAASIDADSEWKALAESTRGRVDHSSTLGQLLAKLLLLPLHSTEQNQFWLPKINSSRFHFFFFTSLLFFPTRLLTVSVCCFFFSYLFVLYVLRCSSNSCNCCLLAACRRFVPATFTSFQHHHQLQHQLHGLYFYLNESRKHVVALCCLCCMPQMCDWHVKRIMYWFFDFASRKFSLRTLDSLPF